MAALALAAVAVAMGGARADLPAGNVRCGEITCPRHQYCSELINRCAPCIEICDTNSNNYVQKTCEQFCQDYIHDERYVNAAIIQSLSRKVQNLTIVSTVALVIAVLLLVMLATLFVRKLRKHKHLLWRFTKRGASHASGKKVGAADDPEAGNKAAEVAAAAAALQLAVPRAGSADESPPPLAPLSRSVSRDVATPATTSTPLSRPRHPSEDTTLDYAYDNPALAPSPSPGKEQAPLGSSTGLSGGGGASPPAAGGFGGRKESSF